MTTDRRPLTADKRPQTADGRRRSLVIGQQSREREIAEQLMIEIRKFVPFKADCYTLICDFYRRCYGIEIPRYEYNSVKQEKPPDKVWEDWQVIEECEARPGDVMLIYSDLGVHTGIVLDGGEYLHSMCIDNPPVRIGRIADIPRDEILISFLKYKRTGNS